VLDPRACRCLSLLQYIDIVKPGTTELHEMCRHVCQAQNIAPFDPGRSRSLCTLLTSSQPVSYTASELLSGLVVPCWMLLRQGLGTVLLSLGAHGCAVCQLVHAKEARERVPLGLVDHSDSRASLVMIHCPSIPVQAVSTTGAGDCLVAGTLAGISSGLTLGDAACIGVAAASRSCLSFENVPKELSWEMLVEDWETLRDKSCAMLWAVDPGALRKHV
jgi:sugar/nucleoside kinase (ribokinase family)